MHNPTAKDGLDLADFFSAAEARNDRWRSLHRVARALSDRPTDKLRTEADALLAELTPLGEFYSATLFLAESSATTVVGFAPPLDKFGNNVRAQEAIRYISEQLDLNIFGSSK